MKQFKTMGYSGIVLLIFCFSSTTGFLETNRRSLNRDSVIQRNDVNDRNFFGNTWQRLGENFQERKTARRNAQFSEREIALIRTDRFQRLNRYENSRDSLSQGKNTRFDRQERNDQHNVYDYNNNRLTTNRRLPNSIKNERSIRSPRNTIQDQAYIERNPIIRQRLFNKLYENDKYRQNSGDRNMRETFSYENLERRMLSRNRNQDQILRRHYVRLNPNPSRANLQLKTSSQREFAQQNKNVASRTTQDRRQNSDQTGFETRRITSEKIENRQLINSVRQERQIRSVRNTIQDQAHIETNPMLQKRLLNKFSENDRYRQNSGYSNMREKILYKHLERRMLSRNRNQDPTLRRHNSNPSRANLQFISSQKEFDRQNKNVAFRTTQDRRQNLAQIRVDARRITTERNENRLERMAANRLQKQTNRNTFVRRNHLESVFSNRLRQPVSEQVNTRDSRIENRRFLSSETESSEHSNRRQNRQFDRSSSEGVSTRNIISRNLKSLNNNLVNSIERQENNRLSFRRSLQVTERQRNQARQQNHRVDERNIIQSTKRVARFDNNDNSRQVQSLNRRTSDGERKWFTQRSTVYKDFNNNRLESRNDIFGSGYKTSNDRQLTVSSSRSANIDYLPEFKSNLLMNTLKAILISILFAQLAAKSHKNKNNWFCNLTNFVAVTKEKVL